MRSTKFYGHMHDGPPPSKKVIESGTFVKHSKDNHQCAEKKCRREATLTYLGKPLCQKHWEAICAKQDKEEVLKKGIQQAKDREFSDSPPDLDIDKKLCDGLEGLGDNDGEQS